MEATSRRVATIVTYSVAFWAMKQIKYRADFGLLVLFFNHWKVFEKTSETMPLELGLIILTDFQYHIKLSSRGLATNPVVQKYIVASQTFFLLILRNFSWKKFENYWNSWFAHPHWTRFEKKEKKLLWF